VNDLRGCSTGEVERLPRPLLNTDSSERTISARMIVELVSSSRKDSDTQQFFERGIKLNQLSFAGDRAIMSKSSDPVFLSIRLICNLNLNFET
jgi:hypothetical protein